MFTKENLLFQRPAACVASWRDSAAGSSENVSKNVFGFQLGSYTSVLLAQPQLLKRGKNKQIVGNREISFVAAVLFVSPLAMDMDDGLFDVFDNDDAGAGGADRAEENVSANVRLVSLEVTGPIL